MATTYEVEIKSLLGEKTQAEILKKKLETLGQEVEFLGKHSQLNHYFTSGDLGLLLTHLEPHIAKDHHAEFKGLINNLRDYSLRTRLADNEVFFVVKASIDDDTSANGVRRLELQLPVLLSLEELDGLILQSGFSYEAKWSREREEYRLPEVVMTIDKNAGYGYVAEFEIVVDSPEETAAAREKIMALMSVLGVEELSQDRLARMFAHYNAHWQEYYGTEKVFVIE